MNARVPSLMLLASAAGALSAACAGPSFAPDAASAATAKITVWGDVYGNRGDAPEGFAGRRAAT